MSSFKNKKMMDTQVAKLVCQFEFRLYKLIDNVMPRKFRSTLIEQLVNTVGSARESLVDGLGLDIRLFAKEKYACLNFSSNKFHNAEIILCHLNDTGSISDKSKAELDILIDDIQNNITRLLNSLSNQMDFASQRTESKETVEACK